MNRQYGPKPRTFCQGKGFKHEGSLKFLRHYLEIDIYIETDTWQRLLWSSSMSWPRTKFICPGLMSKCR